MGLITKIIDKINPRNSPPEIIVKGGENFGYGWFEARNKLAELTGNTTTSILPRMSVQQAFKRYNSWVYHCVNLIQRKIVQTPFHLYRNIGRPNDEEYDRILEHPLLRLLKRPNRFLSGRQFIQVTQTHLDLTGMAFWLVMFNGFGTPGELQILSPGWLTNIIRGENTDNLIEKFAFAPPNQTNLAKEYPYQQIIYFHYPNPEDPMMPMSPLQPLVHILDIDLLLQIYEKDFFTNNARPDGILRTSGDMDETEASRLQESWGNRHRGPGKQHKIAVLTGGIEYQPLGMSAKDFEFPSLADYIKNQILAAYGVPEAELGLFQSFNKASSVSSESKFVKGCIEPRLRLWEDVINSQLLPLYPSSMDCEFRFSSALPRDDEWQLTETQSHLTMGMTTINAERKKQGLTPFPSPLCDVPYGVDGAPIRGVNSDADKLWDEKVKASMGQPPGGMPGIPGAMPGTEDPNTGNPLAQGAMGQLGGRPESSDLSKLYDSATRNSNQTLATLLNAARGNRGGLAELLKNHPEEADLMSMINMSRKDSSLGDLLSKVIKGYVADSLEDDIDKQMFPVHEDLIQKIIPLEERYSKSVSEIYINKGIELAGIVNKMTDNFIQKGDIDFDFSDFKQEIIKSLELDVIKAIELGFLSGNIIVKAINPNIVVANDPEDYAVRNAGRLLDKSSDLQVATTKKAITEIIENSITNGINIEDTADAIKNKFGSFSSARATLIARTELAAAMNEGLNQSFQAANQQSGHLVIKEAKVWTALDERVCKQCFAKHNQLAISYVRDKEYIDLPIHPNCRCVLRPILV